MLRKLLLIVLLTLPVRADGLSLRLLVYDPGNGKVHFTLRVENMTGAPVALSQPTSQTHDFEVTRDGKPIWRWSGDKFFMEMLTDRVFKPGETVTYTGDWEHGKMPPGKYAVRAWLPVTGGGAAPSVTRLLNM